MLIGQRAGNYQLVERLGAGGMGEVYKGVHVQIGSKVAIKVLAATHVRDRGLEERFVREAQAVNRIDHPGVVKVLDAGRMENGRPYLVMELLDGYSLHELRKGGMTVTDACHAMIRVLDAVAAAHAAGVIHRDLKPANIFKTRDGRVVVLDFGIAKLMSRDADVKLTVTGTAIGTPHYMAPEQIRAKPVTTAADIYAAGVVLFELVCGRRPFDAGDEDSVLVGHLEKRPPSPRALNPEVSVELADLILTALAKRPEDRPPSAAAMRDSLRALLAPSPWARPGAAPPSIDPDALVTNPRARRPSQEAATMPERLSGLAEPPARASSPRPGARPPEDPTLRDAPRRVPASGRRKSRSVDHRLRWFLVGSGLGLVAIVIFAVVSSTSSSPTAPSKPRPGPAPRVVTPDASLPKTPKTGSDDRKISAGGIDVRVPGIGSGSGSAVAADCAALANMGRVDLSVEQNKLMAKMFIGWCLHDRWSADSVACFSAAQDDDAQSRCTKMLSESQRAAMTDRFDKIRALGKDKKLDTSPKGAHPKKAMATPRPETDDVIDRLGSPTLKDLQ